MLLDRSGTDPERSESGPRTLRERCRNASGALRERPGNAQRTLSIKTVSTWETHQTLKPTFPNPTDQNPKHSEGAHQILKPTFPEAADQNPKHSGGAHQILKPTFPNLTNQNPEHWGGGAQQTLNSWEAKIKHLSIRILRCGLFVSLGSLPACSEIVSKFGSFWGLRGRSRSLRDVSGGCFWVGFSSPWRKWRIPGKPK